MSLRVTLDGEDVTGDLLFSSSVGTADAATLTFDVAPPKGTAIFVAGSVGGSISGTFNSGGLWSSLPKTPATGKVHRWNAPELSEADQRMIDEFLIESFARGFAKQQERRDALVAKGWTLVP